MKYMINSGSQVPQVDRRLFIEGIGDTICETKSFALELAGDKFKENLLDAVGAEVHSSAHITCAGSDPAEYNITIIGPEQALIQITAGGSYYEPGYEIGRFHFNVTITGKQSFVRNVFERLRVLYGDARLATISWWYKAENRGIEWRTVPMEPPPHIVDELYPFIGGGVNEYLQRFLNDRSSVLFMMGPPGTGKTSLIRHFVYEHRLAATLTYDQDLLGSDQMFIEFLCGASEKAVLIVEDADLILGSREGDSNKLISRFLNVSDGMIKTSDKKMIFTTNLGDFRRVDPALVRAGRCFGAVKFRPLEWQEALSAAAAMGIDRPTKVRDYTLAELFNQDAAPALSLASVGFEGR